MLTFKAETPFRAHSVSWPDAVLVTVLASLALLAWWALWLWGRSPRGHMLTHGSMHGATMPAADPLQLTVIFIGGWTLMTIAMMLPASVPLLLMFHRVVRGRAAASLLVATVILGYLAVWVTVGAALQFFAWLLHAGADRIVWRPVAPHVVSATILCIAGLYQFSPLKHACLEKCRSPLSFLIGHWHGDAETFQALRLGAVHGLFCVGCCWSLMMLMFVVGAGSFAAMLILGVLMAIEKNFSWGRRLSAPLGFLLLAGAAATVLAGVSRI